MPVGITHDLPYPMLLSHVCLYLPEVLQTTLTGTTEDKDQEVLDRLTGRDRGALLADGEEPLNLKVIIGSRQFQADKLNDLAF